MNQATYTGALAGLTTIGAATASQMLEVAPWIKAVAGIILAVVGWFITRGGSSATKIGGGAIVGAGAGLLLDAGLTMAGL